MFPVDLITGRPGGAFGEPLLLPKGVRIPPLPCAAWEMNVLCFPTALGTLHGVLAPKCLLLVWLLSLSLHFRGACSVRRHVLPVRAQFSQPLLEVFPSGSYHYLRLLLLSEGLCLMATP